MALTQFRRICSVRIRHEYYLPGTAAGAFFNLPPVTQNELLSTTFYYKRYRLGNDISIEPTASTKKKLKNYRLKYAVSPQGIAVGADVTVVPQTDGSERFRPRIAFPENLRLDFIIRPVQPTFLTYTNVRLQNVLPYQFLFTNADPAAEKSYPYLALPTADFVEGMEYEPGEVTMQGNQRQQANRRTSSSDPDHWDTRNIDGVMSEADRLLLPRQIQYFLPEMADEIEVRLTDLAGSAVADPMILESEVSQQQWRIDIDEMTFPDGIQVLNDKVLELRIIGPTSDFRRLVVLDSERWQAGAFGCISLYPTSSGDFSMLDEDGLLVTRPNDEGIEEALRFSIRMEGRPTIWRYRSLRGENLQIGSGVNLEGFENDPLGFVRSTDPVAYRFQARYFTANLNEVALPNPSPTAFQEIDDRFVTDVYINKIPPIIQ